LVTEQAAKIKRLEEENETLRAALAATDGRRVWCLVKLGNLTVCIELHFITANDKKMHQKHVLLDYVIHHFSLAFITFCLSITRFAVFI